MKVGAVTSVTPSVCEVPESDAAVSAGVPPLGAVVSSVMVSAAVVELLPKASLSSPRAACCHRLEVAGVTVRLTLPAVMSAADGVGHRMGQRRAAEQQLHGVAGHPVEPSATVRSVPSLGDIVALRGPGIRCRRQTGVPPVGAVVFSV